VHAHTHTHTHIHTQRSDLESFRSEFGYEDDDRVPLGYGYIDLTKQYEEGAQEETQCLPNLDFKYPTYANYQDNKDFGAQRQETKGLESDVYAAAYGYAAPRQCVPVDPLDALAQSRSWLFRDTDDAIQHGQNDGVAAAEGLACTPVWLSRGPHESHRDWSWSSAHEQGTRLAGTCVARKSRRRVEKREQSHEYPHDHVRGGSAAADSIHSAAERRDVQRRQATGPRKLRGQRYADYRLSDYVPAHAGGLCNQAMHVGTPSHVEKVDKEANEQAHVETRSRAQRLAMMRAHAKEESSETPLGWGDSWSESVYTPGPLHADVSRSGGQVQRRRKHTSVKKKDEETKDAFGALHERFLQDAAGTLKFKNVVDHEVDAFWNQEVRKDIFSGLMEAFRFRRCAWSCPKMLSMLRAIRMRAQFPGTMWYGAKCSAYNESMCVLCVVCKKGDVV
jgi:hypothetical protein